MLGVLPREVGVTACEDGSYEAIVELIRTGDGAVIGRASAICGTPDEPTWATRPAYARRSMAITRATGKAYRLGFSWIMALAGYEPTPAEEMTDVVDGEIVHPPQQRKPPKAAPRQAIERPLEPDKLKEFLHRKAGDDQTPATEKQAPFVARKFQEAFAPAEDAQKQYHMALSWLLGVDSATKLTKMQAKALLDWLLDPSGPDDTGDTPLHPSATVEAIRVYQQAMKDAGQQELPL